MTPGWLPSILAIVFYFALPSAFAQDGEIDKQLAAETERLTTELAAKAGLELPPLPAELAKEKPPEIIRRAGDDYVKAWQTYRNVTLYRPLPQKPAVEPRPEKPANGTKEDWANFQDLLVRTLQAKEPPDPAEYEGFSYQIDGPCGTAAIGFWWTHDSGKALALLRKSEYFSALQIVAEKRYSPSLEHLLRAYKVDPDEFIVGAWLNRRLTTYDFPPSSGDRAATMLLKWVELRWQSAGKDSATSWQKNKDEPYYPLEGLMDFLGEDSRANDETKRKIASFLENQGCKLQAPEYWLARMKRGSEKWLVPLVQHALAGKTNEAKTRAAKILTEAGIPHPEPVLRKDPRFRVTVNGKPWPGVLDQGHRRSAPSMFVNYEGGGREFGLSQGEDGTFSADADYFLEGPEITKIGIDGLPGFSNPAPTPPSSAWLRAEVPLPVRFGETTDLDVKLFEFSIEPKLPQGRETPTRLIEIDFGRVADGYPQPRGNCYHLQDASRLTLPYVSPGNYWLRVRHPGAALMPWRKVKVTKNGEMISPELKAGSTLVVPIVWPENEAGKSKLPADAARLLRRIGGSGYMEMVALKKDGKLFTEFGAAPPAATEKFRGCAIFANLAPGTYEIIFHGIDDRKPRMDAKAVDPAPSVKVTIRPNDAVYLLSDPLLVPSPATVGK